jgi:hypothetical protein
LREKGVRIPWKMRLHQEFIEVYGIREKQAPVIIDVQSEKFDEAPAPLVKFRIISDDYDLEDKLSQIIKKQPAYILHGKEDWRLPGFYTTDKSFLVVGGEAYLAWYIRKIGVYSGRQGFD